MDVAALLAAIGENPGDDALYLVLADALTAAGDPHGELIMLQHALAQKPDREVLRAEQAARRAAWPECGPHRATIYKATWRLGFLDTLELDGDEKSIAEVVDTLGKHLATRRVRTIHARAWSAETAALSNLRELVVRSSLSSDREVHQVARLPRLESLDLGIRSIDIATIASMPGALRSLAIRDAKGFGDDHVAATASISTLRRLSLGNLADITDACATRLGENVRELSIMECARITNGIADRLAERPLEGLRLYPVADPEAVLAAAARQPRLRELHVSCAPNTSMTAESIARVLALPELRRLALRCDGEVTGSAQVVSRVEHFSLSVAGCAPGLLASIATSSLRVLDLGRILWSSHVGDAHLAALSPAALLTSLSLGNTSITDAGLRHLHALIALETLDLNNCRLVTTRGVIELARALPALRALDLGQMHNQTGIDSLVGLEHHPSLAKLALANTKIGPSDLAVAATLSNLQSLSLMRTQIRDADLAVLLPLAPTLRHLDVNQCGISKTDVLRQFDALESLNLLNSSIDKTSFAELRRALPNCKIAGEGWELDEYPPSDPFEK